MRPRKSSGRKFAWLIGNPQALLGKMCAPRTVSNIIQQTFLYFYPKILTILFEIKMSDSK